jgi:hypothetical protein
MYNGSNPTKLIGYTDSDWASDIDDRKSTSGYCFIINSGAISWYSKKQPTVAKSTVEAEYMSLGSTGSEAKWITMFLKELVNMENNTKQSTEIKSLATLNNHLLTPTENDIKNVSLNETITVSDAKISGDQSANIISPKITSQYKAKTNPSSPIKFHLSFTFQ